MEDLIRTPLTVVHVLACAFLILVVLLQPGKSGGLGLFATPAATQVFGGRGAGTILSKVTWVTTVVFFLSSISLAYLSTSSDESLQERAAAAEEAKLGNVEKKDEPGPAPAEKKPAPEKPAPEKPAPEQSASEQSVPERSEPEETAPGQPAPPPRPPPPPCSDQASGGSPA